MSRLFVLLVLAFIAIAASQTSPVTYDDGDDGDDGDDEDPEENAIPPTEMKYTNMFQANFTVTVFGIPDITGGGQRDLKQLGKFLLKRTNALQLRKEKKSRTADPDLLVYDIEVLQQYINSAFSASGEEVWYNIFTVLGSYACVGSSCPAGATTINGSGNSEQRERQLLTRHLQSTGTVAEDVKVRLLANGQDYFANVQCVRIVTEESSGCVGLPIVSRIAAVTSV
ncbi:hypothetical protein MHU86_18996 [Fragilaria crotonensis]|nr:hypothetical protein MHU86_18996 [Fragilaria crotonensis]